MRSIVGHPCRLVATLGLTVGLFAGQAMALACGSQSQSTSQNETKHTDDQAGAADAYALMDLLPPGLDVIAVLNGPGGPGPLHTVVRPDERGAVTPEQRLAAWLRQIGLFGQTARSWSTLSKRLGMDEGEASAALLGGPVVIGWSGLGDAGWLGAVGVADNTWVLVSEVSEGTALSVREKLDAVPRRIASGYAVYTVDTGRTGMAVVRDGDAWRIVLAPVKNTATVDACLAAFRAREAGEAVQGAGDGAGGAASNAGVARALGVPIDDAWSSIVSIRYARERGEPVVVTTHGDADAFTARFGARGRYRHGAPVGVLGDVGGDALLSLAMAGEPWNGADAISVRLQEEGESSAGSMRYVDGYTMVVRESGTPGSAQLTGVIAGRVVTDAAFGEMVDRTISTLIGSDDAPAHRGRFPGAVRTHALWADAEAATDAGPWRSGDSRVAWCFTPDDADRSGVVALALGDGATDVAGYAKHGREAWMRSDASAIGADVVASGTARPAALMRAMGTGRDPVGALMSQIEHARWDLRQSGDVLRGEVTIRLVPVKARLGGR